MPHCSEPSDSDIVKAAKAAATTVKLSASDWVKIVSAIGVQFTAFIGFLWKINSDLDHRLTVVETAQIGVVKLLEKMDSRFEDNRDRLIRVEDAQKAVVDLLTEFREDKKRAKQ